MQCSRHLYTTAPTNSKIFTRTIVKPRLHNEDSKGTLRTNDSNSPIYKYIINSDSVLSKRQSSVEFSKVTRQELNTVPEVQRFTLLEGQAMDLKFIDTHMSEWDSKCSSIRSKFETKQKNSDQPSISESPTLLKPARLVKNIITT